MNYFYMCVTLNSNPYDEYPVCSRYFFSNIVEARQHAKKKATIVFLAFNREHYLYHNEIFVDIYKIPFGIDTYIGEDYDTICREFGDYYIDTYRDVKILAVKTIQKHYRIYFKKKMDSVLFLQYSLRKAIANPYTELCRRRLMREFSEFVIFI